jgi:hypothetical protein
MRRGNAASLPPARENELSVIFSPRDTPEFSGVAALDPKVTTYFDQHCLRCHDAKKQKGHLRIDTLSQDFASGQVRSGGLR